MKAAWALAVLAALPALAGQRTQVDTYSSMRYVPAGDVLGWDIQLTRTGKSYAAVMECGEGQPEGPVKAAGERVGAYLVLRPELKACGSTIQLKFVRHGVMVTEGAEIPEFVPQGALSRWFPK